jgi:chorismate mutase
MEDIRGMQVDPFVLVRVEMLPEAIQKTLEAKKLLETGIVKTVQEAVEHVGISRSSFYKYKDSVFPFNQMVKEKMVTISMILEHRAGVLSSVLGFLAASEANVLTIHQTIPLQGEANVSMSVDTSQMNKELNEVLENLKNLSGVRRVVVVGTGE